MQITCVESRNKRKEKFPCLICGGDHFTKECPCHEEVGKFIKNTPTLAILIDTFPTQNKLIEHQSFHGYYLSSKYEVKMMLSE